MTVYNGRIANENRGQLYRDIARRGLAALGLCALTSISACKTTIEPEPNKDPSISMQRDCYNPEAGSICWEAASSDPDGDIPTIHMTTHGADTTATHIVRVERKLRTGKNYASAFATDPNGGRSRTVGDTATILSEEEARTVLKDVAGQYPEFSIEEDSVLHIGDLNVPVDIHLRGPNGLSYALVYANAEEDHGALKAYYEEKLGLFIKYTLIPMGEEPSVRSHGNAFFSGLATQPSPNSSSNGNMDGHPSDSGFHPPFKD